EENAPEVGERLGPLRGRVRERAAGPGAAAVGRAIHARLCVRIPRADVTALAVDERDAVLALRGVEAGRVHAGPGRRAVGGPPERDALPAALRLRRASRQEPTVLCADKGDADVRRALLR